MSEQKPQTDEEVALQCVLLTFNLANIKPADVGPISLELRDYVLDGIDRVESTRRFNLARELAIRFPKLPPAQLVTLTRVITTGVVEKWNSRC